LHCYQKHKVCIGLQNYKLYFVSKFCIVSCIATHVPCRYQRNCATPSALFMPRDQNYFVQFYSRISTQTSSPEILCAKIAGERRQHNRSYQCQDRKTDRQADRGQTARQAEDRQTGRGQTSRQEKHPINLDVNLAGQNTLTLHKLCKGFWMHKRSLCMPVDDDSYAPLIMEFEETRVNTPNPRLLHLIRLTTWPAYMNEAL
jgi:hypothetical protein